MAGLAGEGHCSVLARSAARISRRPMHDARPRAVGSIPILSVTVLKTLLTAEIFLAYLDEAVSSLCRNSLAKVTASNGPASR
jgi:hypothetical protein